MSNSNDDISIEELFKVLDSAFTSNNPAVKKALKNFLMIAAIVHAEDSNPVEGPMQQLLRKINELERQIRSLEATRTSAPDIIAQLESFVELENESKRLEKYFKIDAK
jgi:hypothetical protein